jgi:hypothetical protein
VNEGITKQIIDASFFPKSGASTLDLFFHCISFLIYPLFLGLLWRAIGYTSLSWIDGWRDRDMRIRIGAEMAIGMGIFVVGLLILGATHMLTLTGLISILVIYSILSYRGWIETYRDLMDRRIVLDQHDTDIGAFEMIRPKLLSIEFGFLLVTFLISVSLINAIRPMPIGWDDLGVYMNYPRIMALTESYLTGAGLYTWQLITSTGFLWNQIAAQAFYVNQLGGILSMVTIISVLSYLFSFTGKKYLISLPVILGIIYYLMPMTIFQQAKDMKIDPALMSVSVAAFGLLWYTLREKLLSRKTGLILM